jgi:heptosyltransferase-3
MNINPADAIPQSDIRRVLVIKLRNHGDVLLTSPVFTVLKENLTHAEVDALVYADTSPMLKGNPAITRIHAVKRSAKTGPVSALFAELRLLRELRSRRYDLVVHLTDHNRGARLCRILRPRFAVTHAGAFRAFFKNSFTHLTPTPKGGKPRHTVETHLDALRRLGIHPDSENSKRLVIVPGAEAESRADALLAEHGLAPGKFILIHPGSRWLFKCWPADRIRALIAKLSAEGARIAVTGAPDPKELELVQSALRDAPAGVVDLSAQLSLRELAAIIGRAGVFFGVDSVPMHIAAATGTPAVAIFGPSSDGIWGPWMAEHTVLRAPGFTCAPCNIDGCGGSKRSACIEVLGVETVHSAIRKYFPLTSS